jgi:hypothetical protein
VFNRCSFAILTAVGVASALPAHAQDIVLAVPVVPSAVGPVLAWVLTVAGGMISLFVPLVAIWFRQYLGVQNTQARSQMINGSVVRAAALADLDMTRQHLTLDEVGPRSLVMRDALNYVGRSHPDVIAVTPQASDEHLAKAITAEMHQIAVARGQDAAPTVVLSPVSLVR